MSNAPLHSESSFEESPPTDSLPATVRGVVARLARACRAAGFWTAVGLPFVYLPMLAGGLDSTSSFLAFLCLLLLNVAALFAGRGYE